MQRAGCEKPDYSELSSIYGSAEALMIVQKPASALPYMELNMLFYCKHSVTHRSLWGHGARVGGIKQ